MSDDLITLWRYRDLPEALIAHSKLKSERFDCFLADDNMVRFDWYWSNMLGGVRLRVREDDAESALEVLGEDIPERFSAEEVGEEYEQPACPKCVSRDVGFEVFNRAAALVALYIGIPFTIPKNRWHCEDCGNEWKGEYV